MDEYIEREADMYIAFKYPFFSDSLMEEIKDIPAAYVAPARHGHWNAINKIATWLSWKYRCNDCGCHQEYTHNYCHNCGEKMDEFDT